MAVTSSGGNLYRDSAGAYYTYSNAVAISSDNSDDLIGSYGAFNQIFGNGGNDAIGALVSSRLC